MKIKTKMLIGHIKHIEKEHTKHHVSGVGKDAVFGEKLIGHRLIMDSGMSFIVPSHLQCDYDVGDIVSMEIISVRENKNG